MWSLSSTDWNHAIFGLAGYGIGLILFSAVAQGILLGNAGRRNALHDGHMHAVARLGFASWPRRFIALVIDWSALAAVAALPAIAVHPVAGAIVLCLSASLYFPFGYGAGYTLGTLFTGIRIVNRRGIEPGLSRGALRYLMFFSTMFPRGGRSPGIAAPGGILFCPATMQGGHDRFAGTYVVRKH